MELGTTSRRIKFQTHQRQEHRQFLQDCPVGSLKSRIHAWTLCKPCILVWPIWIKDQQRASEYTSIRSLIQSKFLPFRTYFDFGCLITNPSPLASMTSSIFSLISLAVFPLYSVTNSMRPWTSLRHCLIFFFRNAVERWISDWPLRYKRSKTLTTEMSEMVINTDIVVLTTRSGIMLGLGLIYGIITLTSLMLSIKWLYPEQLFSKFQTVSFVQRRGPTPAFLHPK